MQHAEIDSDWFKTKLEDNNMSMRDLAKRMDMNISSLSRTFSGDRKMQMDEAKQIAHFLRAPVSEVMRHAGVAVDLDGLPTRIMLTMIINEAGESERLTDPTPLPQNVIDKAQAAIRGAGNGQILAAQIRAEKGPLAMWDDAVVLFKPSDIIEPASIGSLAIVRSKKSGRGGLVRVLSARKTGETKMKFVTGETVEAAMDTATPVIALIP